MEDQRLGDEHPDPVYQLGGEEIREVLQAMVVTLEEWGYKLDLAGIVVSGALRNGEPFRAVQVTLPTNGDAHAIRLLLWGAEKVAQDADR